MSTATLGDTIINLLSIVVPAATILPALYGSKFIKTLGRRYMILQSLRSANHDFNDFYIKIEYPLNPVYPVVAILVMLILSVISLLVVNLGAVVYGIMLIVTFVAFTAISIFSIVLYLSIMRYQMRSTAEIPEEKVMKFKKWWRRLAGSWVIVVTSYIIPAMNIEGYYGFFLNYEIQDFIWIAIPLTLIFFSIIFFLFAGLLSRDLTWAFINRKLAKKSLLPEIDAYVRGIDGKLETIHGFVIDLGKYVKLETAKTFEILKYADIQRISSPKEMSDLKCK